MFFGIAALEQNNGAITKDVDSLSAGSSTAAIIQISI